MREKLERCFAIVSATTNTRYFSHEIQNYSLQMSFCLTILKQHHYGTMQSEMDVEIESTFP